jgi:hypothetical protein
MVKDGRGRIAVLHRCCVAAVVVPVPARLVSVLVVGRCLVCDELGCVVVVVVVVVVDGWGVA